MKFEVYCDESLPDLFTSQKPRAKYLMIGALWLPADLREEAKAKIARLRERHNVHGEMKWRKISPSRADFYAEVIDLFFAYGLDMRFRCIAVDHKKTNLDHFHDGDSELGFYKFYYQLLHHWILDFNEYTIFCDLKSNRSPTRLAELRKVLSNANLSSDIANVQPLPSGQLVLMQVCDILLGAASSRLNFETPSSPAKLKIVERVERSLGHRIKSTWKSEEKFNVFKIDLKGGW
jgi:Protein of unknown function (DUF3800)